MNSSRVREFLCLLVRESLVLEFVSVREFSCGRDLSFLSVILSFLELSHLRDFLFSSRDFFFSFARVDFLVFLLRFRMLEAVPPSFHMQLHSFSFLCSLLLFLHSSAERPVSSHFKKIAQLRCIQKVHYANL